LQGAALCKGTQPAEHLTGLAQSVWTP